MVGVGLVVFFAGYTLTYYGVSQLRGGNYGLLDLVVPGRWAAASKIPTDKDGASPSSSSAGSATIPAGAAGQSAAGRGGSSYGGTTVRPAAPYGPPNPYGTSPRTV